MRPRIEILVAGGNTVTGVRADDGSAGGPLLVCLPGGHFNARHFGVPGASFLDAAAASGFSACALDRPGYGGSSPLPPGSRVFSRMPASGRDSG
jgi:pimeloyl-ACP methyl ester carboxylesterase